ncbi:hypothetical protein C9374_002466 [Naegleria lovaniensis]|uniref:methionine--tRNA ligase n=1 Tax=Naegleria lovaniensis TaxID=51637 RepID=A0AA88GPY1_NAELO|nr:uncharacterized protein C9374_002466 [Naegleria lovaniensis]KAG2386722.1 hypothetical protein C9374_002466 [Naegleria lovaniensis]
MLKLQQRVFGLSSRAGNHRMISSLASLGYFGRSMNSSNSNLCTVISPEWKHQRLYYQTSQSDMNDSTNKTTGGLITTPIYYVNGPPHIGHFFTSILSDTLFLYHKILKNRKDMIFSTGTDEHGSKVQRTAIAAYLENLKKSSPAGTPIPSTLEDSALIEKACVEFCEQISNHFQKLMNDFQINHTYYLRTSATTEHRETVINVWKHLQNQGDIYIGEYQGWYCTTDEAFTTETEQYKITHESGQEEWVTINRSSGNRCEYVTEKNYKFRLSKYIDRVEKWLQENPNVIKPKERYNELMEMIKKEKERPPELLDLSISRTRDRVQWGIPVPGDPEHTIYVWLDALTNYLTVGCTMGNESLNWPPTIQVIGKDILKFHGIYWPAFLMALGKDLPETLLVHSYWLVNGVKMSKSLKNVISPYDLLAETGVQPDLLRYYLLSEALLSTDSSFSMIRFPMKVNELADIFGNLLARTFNKKFHSEVREIPYRNLRFEHVGEVNPNDIVTELIEQLNDLREQVRSAYEDKLEVRFANAAATKLLKRCNQLFNEVKPWELVKNPEKNALYLEELMFLVGETLRNCAIALYPVLPEKMTYILSFFNQGQPLLQDIGFCQKGTSLKIQTDPKILFKKIAEVKQEGSQGKGNVKQKH